MDNGATAEPDRPEAPPPRHRPLIPVLAGMAAGIALDGTLRPPLWFWPALGFGVAGAVLWSLRVDRRRWSNWVLALVLMLSVGGVNHALRFRSEPAHHLKNLPLAEGGLYRVRGRGERAPEARYRRSAFRSDGERPSRFWFMPLRLEAVSLGDGRWREAEGGLAVFWNYGAPDFRVGDTVEFLTEINRNRPPTNPGQSDRALAYARMGSHGTASVPSAAAIRVVRRAKWYGSPSVAVGRLRTMLMDRLEDRLPAGGAGKGSGLLRALLFGRRGGLTPREQRLFRESGTLHFLAISGLHVGIFCFFISVLLVWLPVSPGVRHVLVIAGIWFYVLFTGFHVSSVRAAGMLTFILAAPLLHRRTDSLCALLGAATVILLISPPQLFLPGFQLTFLAVCAMVTIYPQLADILWPWQDFLSRAWAPEERTLWTDLRVWGQSYLVLSLTVWVATAPVVAYHFNLVSFVAPVLNLLVWPVVACLLPVGMLLLVVLAVAPWAAAPLVWLALFLAEDIHVLLEAARHVPGFGVYVPAPPLWWIGLFYAGLGLWVMRRRLRAGRWFFLAVVLALCLTYIWQDAAIRLRRDFRITVADVGHGQAVVCRLPEGRNTLFDAGSWSAGRAEVMAGILWEARMDALGAVVISHMNADHCNFLPYLSRRFAVGRVVVPMTAGGGSLRQDVRDLLDRRGIPVRRVQEGARLSGGGLHCRVLHPDERFAAGRKLSENERSLVLLCRYRGLRFLLPGDVQSAAIQRLCRAYGPGLDADILMMPHHGSYHEGLEEFVGYVSPLAAVVSGGPEDCDERTRQLLDRRGVPLWTTSRDGAVIITRRGDRVRLRGYASGRQAVFRYRDKGGTARENR